MLDGRSGAVGNTVVTWGEVTTEDRGIEATHARRRGFGEGKSPCFFEIQREGRDLVALERRLLYDGGYGPPNAAYAFWPLSHTARDATAWHAPAWCVAAGGPEA